MIEGFDAADIYHAKPGDVFRLSDGRLFLYDWDDGWRFGFNISDGTSGCYHYFNDFTRRLINEGAVLIQHDDIRWTHGKTCPNPEASAAHLAAYMAREKI